MTNWDRIVSVYGPAVFGTVWRILGHAEDSEDVVQEVFQQAYPAHQGQLIHCWDTFLRRLATCQALDRLRRRRLSASVGGLRPTSIASGTQENDLSERLREAIARLNHSEATIFCLSCFEGFDSEKIAVMMQTTPAAVAASLHKARGRLETMLHESGRQKVGGSKMGLAEPSGRKESL